MFYSQFILAKKGPLGTIWIAAHLERKLKKNQVADTDIGDSVDSILFPDVPIALRLSSHLLLGVVRIYSRKVNYLFHDCSEALLKVKQAFRSTAVDLPPEESTAPYHSITLPETFDLDDFELPDSALLNGNFDDRHVTSREQITLQHTLDGTGYSTSQFGLDERFGDGDASQIGLDLDEELLLDNNLKLQHDPASYGDAHKGEGASDLAKMDVDEAQLGGDEDRNNEASRELSELLCNDRDKHVISDVQNVNRINDSSHRLVFNIQTPDLNEVFLPDDRIGGPSGAHNIDMNFVAADPPSLEFDEFANFPSTSIPANCQELPSSNPQEILPYTDLANGKLDKPINQEVECPDATNKNLVNATSTNPELDKPINQEVECPDATKKNIVNATSTNPELDNVAQAVSSPTSILDEPKSVSAAPQCSGGIFPYTDLANGKLDKPINQEVECPDATNKNLVNATSPNPELDNVAQAVSSPTSILDEPKSVSVNLVNATSPNPELDNVAQAVSSPTSILDEPKSVSVAPQCSGGIFPSSNPLNDVHHIHNDSNDATNSGNLVSIESTDPKLSEVSWVLPSSTSVLPEAVPDSLVPCSDGTVDTPGWVGFESTLRTTDNSRVLPSSTLVLPEVVPDSVVPPCSDGTVDTPGWFGFESTLRTTDNSHAGIVWNEANNLRVSVDKGIPYEDTTRLSNLDQRRVEKANPYQTNNFSALSSDFQMRSCTSVSNQANLTFPGDMLLKMTPGFSSRDQPCNLETPMVDQELHFSGSSLGPQGFPSVAIDTNLGSHQKSNYIQLGHRNRFSSSEFSEPERMLFAPSRNINLSSDFGLQTIEKGVVESDGSVDRISNLHGKKRHLLDNTPESQNGISPDMSGIPRKKQNIDHIIPKDDDLLASILVGRRTPALKIGPTPPLPKPPSSKRPRLTQKVGMPKRRKVLLDDTIVLHADAIRQQLMNTEDMRRMRRKAPFTCPEIWRIQKSFVEEDDIFCESIFIGISDELNSLPRRYDPVQNMHAQANGYHSSGEAIKEFEVSKSSRLVRDDDGREIAVQSSVVTERVDGEIQGASGGELIDAESCQNAVSVDAPEQLESSFEVPFDSKIEENRNNGLADAEHNSLSKEFQTSHEIAEVNDAALHTAALVSFEEFTSADCVAVNDGTSVQVEDLSNAKAASITVEDMGVDIVNITNLDCPQDEQAGMTKDHSDGASASMLDKFIVEVGADFPEDSSTVIEHVGLVCGDAVVDGEKTASEVTCGEMPNMVSFPVPSSTEGERVPSAVGENSCMNAEGGLGVESTPMELAAARESNDFCSAIDDVDTVDFLNVDDDAEHDEETINDAPHTEEAQSLENSGWSSRTRGVARYLKILFDQESGRARKSVAVDHLLAGKTCKEASRMFFETLVLKTRDYIHVEQDDPFGCINIKPRIKLLKTEF